MKKGKDYCDDYSKYVEDSKTDDALRQIIELHEEKEKRERDHYVRQ